MLNQHATRQHPVNINIMLYIKIMFKGAHYE